MLQFLFVVSFVGSTWYDTWHLCKTKRVAANAVSPPGGHLPLCATQSWKSDWRFAHANVLGLSNVLGGTLKHAYLPSPRSRLHLLLY